MAVWPSSFMLEKFVQDYLLFITHSVCPLLPTTDLLSATSRSRGKSQNKMQNKCIPCHRFQYTLSPPPSLFNCFPHKLFLSDILKLFKLNRDFLLRETVEAGGLASRGGRTTGVTDGNITRIIDGITDCSTGGTNGALIFEFSIRATLICNMNLL